MPHLKVDRHGRFYETSPDRADGSGYKGHAPRVSSTKDVYYGSPYLKFEQENKQETLRNRQRLGMEDQKRRQVAAVENQKRADMRQREEIKRQLMRQPKMQKELMKRALNGCCSEFGKLHQSQGDIQAAVKHAITGMGRDTSIGVSSMERLRDAHQNRAQEIFAKRAHVAEMRRVQERQSDHKIKTLAREKEKAFGRKHESRSIDELYAPRRKQPLLKSVEPIVIHPLQLLPRR